MAEDTIKVHESGHAFIARWRGKTASRTAGPLLAAWAVGDKVLGHRRFRIAGGPRGDGRYVYHLSEEVS